MTFLSVGLFVYSTNVVSHVVTVTAALNPSRPVAVATDIVDVPLASHPDGRSSRGDGLPLRGRPAVYPSGLPQTQRHLSVHRATGVSTHARTHTHTQCSIPIFVHHASVSLSICTNRKTSKGSISRPCWRSVDQRTETVT